MPKVSKTKKTSKMPNNNNMDMSLLITVLMTLALGIVMVLSASAPSALAEYGDSYVFVRKQCFSAVLGILSMLAFSVFNYKIFKKYYKIIYWISILALFTVLIPGLGSTSNGARRWINLGFTTLQPSEITKVGLIIYFAGYFTDPNNKLDTFTGNTLNPIIRLFLPILVMYKVQNHMSAGVVVAIIVSVIIFMSGCKLRYYLILLCGGASSLLLMLPLIKDKVIGGFRSDRINAWLDPFADPRGVSYQTVQGLYAIGSGGLFGVGLGKSTQKHLYIPEAHNDFIFAILAEELGFVGCTIVLVLFTIITIRGILISVRSNEMFGSLVAIGITALISVQAILNIAVVTNVIPNTGISLPFFSFGGTSLIILLSSVGILLNISRSAKKI